MKNVATYGKIEDAYLARTRLESCGIPAFIPDEITASMIWLRVQAMGGVRLQVEEEDFEQARVVLDALPSEDGFLECPYCGSHDIRLRELALIAAVSMALGPCIPIRTRKADCTSCRRSFDGPET